MPRSLTTLGPLGEQLAAPRVVPARGAREHERAHPLGVHHADDLRDDAAHRRADDVRALDALRVEHLDRVLRHPHEVVRPGRRVGVAGAAVVERDAAVAAAERAALERPAAAVMPRPWIISTGEPSRRPHVSYAMCVPSSVTVADMTRGYRRVSPASSRAPTASRIASRNAPPRAGRPGRTDRAA